MLSQRIVHKPSHIPSKHNKVSCQLVILSSVLSQTSHSCLSQAEARITYTILSHRSPGWDSFPTSGVCFCKPPGWRAKWEHKSEGRPGHFGGLCSGGNEGMNPGIGHFKANHQLENEPRGPLANKASSMDHIKHIIRVINRVSFPASRQHALPWGPIFVKDLSRLGRDLDRGRRLGRGGTREGRCHGGVFVFLRTC